MENAVKVAEVAGPVYMVIGLSFLIYLKPWQTIITSWLKNHYTMLPLALVQLVLGIIIIRMYNVWTWDVWLLVTVSGWAMLVKSVVYFLAPGPMIKWALSLRKSRVLIASSAVLLIVWGGVMGYYAYYPLIQTLVK